MARWIGRSANFECISCGSTHFGIYWQPGDAAAYLEEIDNETFTKNVGKLHCSCPSPHVVVNLRRSDGTTVQCRASQRAVVYEHPDGSWESPETNDPMDPMAVRAASDGAVRREFYSVRELRQFQRNRSKTRSDELTGSNEVLDFDEGSRRREDTLTREKHALHIREGRLRDAFSMLRISGGGSGGQRYDRALENQRRRGR